MFNAQTKTFASLIDYTKPQAENLAQYLNEAFARNASRTLLVDASSDRKWTGQQLLDASKAIGAHLVNEAKLNAGNQVFIVTKHNDFELIVACGVFLAGGAVFTSSLDDGFVEHILYCQLMKPAFIITNPLLHQQALDLRDAVPECHRAKIVWLDVGFEDSFEMTPEASSIAHRDDVLLISDFLKSQPLTEAQLELLEQQQRTIEPTHDGYSCITSGSTGKSKFVVSSQLGVVHQLSSIVQCATKKLAGKNVPLLGFEPDSVLASDLPLDVGAGFCHTMAALSVGLKTVVMPMYDPSSFWSLVGKHAVTCNIASNSLGAKSYKRLAELILRGKHHELKLDSLRFIMSSGSKLSITKYMQIVLEEFPKLHIFQIYGNSETAFVSANIIDEAISHPDSVGYLSANFKARILESSTGQLVEPLQSGELLLNTPNLFSKYYTQSGVDPEEQRKAVLWTDPNPPHELYYRTGDLAHFDADGRLYIEGRLKEQLVLMYDLKMTPLEFEVVINEHPLVSESAVVGVPDLDSPSCDAPRAYVVLVNVFDEKRAEKAFDSFDPKLLPTGDKDKLRFATSASQLRAMFESNDVAQIEADVEKFYAQRVVDYRRLSGGVKVVDKLPLTGLMNKVDRRKLREIALLEWQQLNHNSCK